MITTNALRRPRALRTAVLRTAGLRTATLLAPLVLGACETRREPAPGDSASPASATAAAPPARQAVGAPASPEVFRALRWIEGTWQGSGGKYAAFFERYEFADDSTIRISHFADSTLGGRTDGGRVELRGGVVRNEGGSSRWIATALDSNSIRFEPAGGTGGGFTWRRADASSWTAALHGAGGRDTSVVYVMKRMKGAAR